jgi:hypothetical protein
MLLPVSPRKRRRVLWAVGAVAVLAAGAGAAALLPSHAKPERVVHLSGPTQVVTMQHEVPMTPSRRRAIARVLNVFVPAAVERQDPLRALPLVTSGFRGGSTRTDWAKGSLPVLPYHARGATFGGDWTLNYAYPDEMSIDVMLHPARRETLGALTSTVVLKRSRGRWLIDSWVPAAAFSRIGQTPRVTAERDYSTGAKLSPVDKPLLDKRWLLVPAAVLLAALVVPLGIGIAHWRRGRRAWREYRRGYELSSRGAGARGPAAAD